MGNLEKKKLAIILSIVVVACVIAGTIYLIPKEKKGEVIFEDTMTDSLTITGEEEEYIYTEQEDNYEDLDIDGVDMKDFEGIDLDPDFGENHDPDKTSNLPTEQQTPKGGLDLNGLILPIGLHTIESVNEWMLKNKLVKDLDNLNEIISLDFYVDYIENLMDNQYLPKLETKYSLPNEYKDNKSFNKVFKQGYLSLINEEELKDKKQLTVNNFTRIMTSVIGLYEPYREIVDEQEVLNILGSVDNIDNIESMSECKKKKYLHLMQTNTFPLTYNNEHPATKELTKQDLMIMTVFMVDIINLHDYHPEDLGCAPCEDQRILDSRE